MLSSSQMGRNLRNNKKCQFKVVHPKEAHFTEYVYCTELITGFSHKGMA